MGSTIVTQPFKLLYTCCVYSGVPIYSVAQILNLLS